MLPQESNDFRGNFLPALEKGGRDQWEQKLELSQHQHEFLFDIREKKKRKKVRETQPQ